jgi:hypothetical protein
LQTEVKPIAVKAAGFLPDLSAKGASASSNGMELMDGERELWAGACKREALLVGACRKHSTLG